MVAYRIVVLAMLLAACSHQNDVDAPINLAAVASLNAAAPAPAAAPFDVNEVDARDLIDTLGPEWKSMTLQEPSEDGYTGGHSRELIGQDRSATIFTLPDGHVWDLQLRSGMGDHCGKPDLLITQIDRILRKLAPGTVLTSEQHDRIVRGLRSNGSSEIIELGDIQLGGSGLCVRRLDIRKPQNGA